MKQIFYRMSVRLYHIFIFLSIIMGGGIANECAAQTPVDSVRRNALIDSVSAQWPQWQVATISGKLRMEGLPLSPSVKIYMLRDSCVRISLRAPLMGEVGRAEIEGDSILVVNKMKKTYVKESLDSLLQRYPVTISDVQDILLGRISLPGLGELSPERAQFVEIYEEAEGRCSLVPAPDFQPDDFSYGYLIDNLARVETLMVVPLSKPEVYVTLSYAYGIKGYDLTVVYESPDKTKGGTLELNYPQWDNTPIEPIKLNGRYIKMNPEDFLKSF